MATEEVNHYARGLHEPVSEQIAEKSRRLPVDTRSNLIETGRIPYAERRSQRALLGDTRPRITPSTSRSARRPISWKGR